MVSYNELIYCKLQIIKCHLPLFIGYLIFYSAIEFSRVKLMEIKARIENDLTTCSATVKFFNKTFKIHLIKIML